MDLQPILLNNMKINMVKQNRNLKIGDTLKGRIIGIDGNMITIDFGNGDVITGELKVPIDFKKGALIDFIIKDMRDSQLIMSPYSDESIKEANENLTNKTINDILNQNGLKSNDKNVQIVKSLLEMEMPINKETISNISKIVDKLNSFKHMGNDEIIQTIFPEGDPLEENILQTFKTKLDKPKIDVKGKNLKEHMDEDMSKEIIHKKNSDIDNKESKVREKNYIDSKGALINKSTEVNHVLKLRREAFQNIIEGFQSNNNLIKSIALLMKSNIDVSIKNINFLNQIIQREGFIVRDIENLIQLLESNDIVTEDKDIKKIVNGIKKWTGKTELNMELKNVEEFKTEYRDLMNSLEDLKESSIINKYKNTEVISSLKNIEEKVNFVNQLNNNMTFFYMPLITNREFLNEKLYIFNKKKNLGNLDNTKVFLSLNTKNLNKIDILCDFHKDRVNISFNIEDEFVKDFLAKNESKLINMLNKNGFKNVFINYKDREKDIIADFLFSEKSKNYMIDIRV